MKRMFAIKHIAAFAGLVMLLSVSIVSAQKPALKKKSVNKRPVAVKHAEPVYTIEAGTVIRTRMDKNISSKTAVVGNTFTTTVTEPVYSSNGVVVIPVGSKLTAKITSAKPADKGGKPGEIDAAFISVRLPNGHTRAIKGSLTDLESGKTRSDNEGGVNGDQMKNRKVIFIGGGAAGGAILGAMVGGGKGSAIGAIVGACAGFFGERYMKGPEAEVKSGTAFSVILDQPVSLPKFAEATPVS